MAVQGLGVDAHKFAWYRPNEFHAKAEAMADKWDRANAPQVNKYRFLLWLSVSFAVLSLLAIAVTFPAWLSGDMWILNGLIVIGLALFPLAFYPDFPESLRVPVASAFGVLCLSILIFAPDDRKDLLLGDLPLLLAAGLGWPALFFSGLGMNRVTRKIKSSRITPRNNPYRTTDWIIGQAGGVGGAAAIFGEQRATEGALGELRTADIMHELLPAADPGVRIYHGLRFPGSLNADVDHAVVSGNRVILIDSKLYKPSELSLVPDEFGSGAVYIQKDGYLHQTAMVDAMEGYRKILPVGTELETIILVHSKTADKPVHVTESNRVGNIMITNVQDGIDYIGRRISQHQSLYNFDVNDIMKRNMKG